MKIEVKKFGEILMSHPAGREAWLVIEAYLQPATKTEPIELDFSGVLVMGPSWLDEVLAPLQTKFGDRVVCLPTSNTSVIESLKAISPEE